MRLDVNALGTFYRMAREGAGLAAGRLTRMTGVETQVGITKLNFMRGTEIRRDFGDGTDRVGVRVELSGGLDGHSVVVFDRESALRIVETLINDAETDEFDEMNRSAATEVGNIMNNGFVDGWADVLETVIDVSTPEFIEGTTVDAFFGDIDEAPDDDDLALLFHSNISAIGTEMDIGFSHYLFPRRESMAQLLEQLRTNEGIEYDKLDGFDRMAEQGAEEVAKTATTLTGIDTSVEIRRLNFVSLEAIPEAVSNETLVGVAFEFDGTPSGYLVFLFDEASAHEIIDAMVPMSPDDGDDEFGEMGKSAIMELGNIMASGFLDGWANVLDTTIDHSTPEFIHDIGSAAIDPVIIQLGESQDFAFVFDTVVVADGREFDCEIYAIPDESDLERALNDLDVDKIDETPTTAEFGEIENT
ncbi:chemotaxis protein CheC [Natronobiforma cellulositropha]|uniref:chemotaxis protein CheC n=1 Tax=Natronobiforma cellulositropha TaxID=1679076 RepID=UPI0021D5C452|nr:chemotaxis protein CheC [Natronobiforma cellulositropha]